MSEPVAYLKDVGGNESDLGSAYDECLVVAAKGDPGAFPVYALPPARVEEGPRVKTLEWVVRANYTFLAAECVSTVGYYAIYNVSDGFQWDYNHKDKGRATTIDEAKAAAQAHYEALILGELE